jgi:hypothetical protein
MTVLRIFETLDKLNVEENYLPKQIFNMNETSLFWKQMPERAFIHKEDKSMPGFKVCVSTPYEVHTMTLPNYTFLGMYPHSQARHDCVWKSTIMKSLLLCDVKHHRLVVTDILGHPFCPIF